MRKQFFTITALIIFIVSGCSKQAPDSESTSKSTIKTNSSDDVLKPKYAARIVCYLGKIGSGSFCASNFYDPNSAGASHFAVIKHELTCGYLGKISQITWKFIEHKDNQDLYSFERKFPIDIVEYTMTSETVAFSGKQVIVFQDEHQTVVIDTPE